MTPRLRFLRLPHSCNYCGAVNGVTFRAPRVVPRLLWVRCQCGKSHYICRGCARRVGSTRNGVAYVAECAKGYARRHKKIGVDRKGEPNAASA